MRTLTLVALARRPARRRGGRTATAPAASPAATTFVLTGGGWGHGVGMSQWGAFGQAKAGRGYKEILGHYYPGTTLGGAGEHAAGEGARPRSATASARVAVTSTAPIVVVDGTGKRLPAAGRRVTVDRKLELPVGKEGAAEGRCRRRSRCSPPTARTSSPAGRRTAATLRGLAQRRAAPARQHGSGSRRTSSASCPARCRRTGRSRRSRHRRSPRGPTRCEGS